MPPQQNQVPPVSPQYVAPSQPAPVSVQKPSEVLAIVALVLGIVGLVPLIGVLFAIAAIIVGFIGLFHIKKGIASGHGMALSGTILGFVGLVMTAITIMTFVMTIVSSVSTVFSTPHLPTVYTPATTFPSSVGQ